MVELDDVVTRIPILSDGCACPYCKTLRRGSMWSFNGFRYRCFGCLRVLLHRVIDLRSLTETDKEIQMITSKTEHDEKVRAARDTGYTDFKERGAYEPSLLTCRCLQCRLAYLEGQDKAFEEKVNKYEGKS